jgi:hypothetical protein
MVAPYAEGQEHEAGRGGGAGGYSLRGVIHGLLGEPLDAGAGPDPGVHLLHLDRETTEWIYRGLALLLLLALWIRTWPPATRRDPVALHREFALYAATMVIVAPLSRAAHFVVVLPAAMWWSARVLERPTGRNGALLALAAALINLPSVLLPSDLKLALSRNGTLLAGALLLWGALLVTRHADARAARIPSTR